MFGSAASGSPASRIASSASSAACGPAPWFVPIAATSSSASRSAAAAASMPPAVSASSSKVRSATIGSDETSADGLDRRDELVEVEERLDHEQVDAASLEHARLLGVQRPVLARVEHLELAERADRAGDQHVAAGDVARLARQADARRVDRLELVIEELRRQLAPVGAEGVRLDQLGAGADVARVHRDHALGRAQVRLLGAAQAGRRPGQQRTHAAVGHDRRAAAQSLEEVRHPPSLLAARNQAVWSTHFRVIGQAAPARILRTSHRARQCGSRAGGRYGSLLGTCMEEGAGGGPFFVSPQGSGRVPIRKNAPGRGLTAIISWPRE